MQKTNSAVLPRWHHLVFRQECEEGRRSLLRVPTDSEQEALLPILATLHRRQCFWDLLVGSGMTAAAIRRATGLHYSLESVHRFVCGAPPLYTLAEKEALDRLWIEIFGSRGWRKELKEREDEGHRVEAVLATPVAQPSQEERGGDRKIPAENLLDLLDVMAQRHLFGGENDVLALRGAALRCRIKCGFSDAYLENRIREALGRVADAEALP